MENPLFILLADAYLFSLFVCLAIGKDITNETSLSLVPASTFHFRRKLPVSCDVRLMLPQKTCMQ